MAMLNSRFSLGSIIMSDNPVLLNIMASFGMSAPAAPFDSVSPQGLWCRSSRRMVWICPVFNVMVTVPWWKGISTTRRTVL